MKMRECALLWVTVALCVSRSSGVPICSSLGGPHCRLWEPNLKLPVMSPLDTLDQSDAFASLIRSLMAGGESLTGATVTTVVVTDSNGKKQEIRVAAFAAPENGGKPVDKDALLASIQAVLEEEGEGRVVLGQTTETTSGETDASNVDTDMLSDHDLRDGAAIDRSDAAQLPTASPSAAASAIISIYVRQADGLTTLRGGKFRMSRDTRLGQLFKKYCAGRAISPSSVVFTWQGQPVSDTETPASVRAGAVYESGYVADATVTELRCNAQTCSPCRSVTVCSQKPQRVYFGIS